MDVFDVRERLVEGGPAGYWGLGRTMVFDMMTPTEWGGYHATRSQLSASHTEHNVAVGDVVVAFQTDDQSVIGLSVISDAKGPSGDRTLPIGPSPTPFKMHRHKQGTSLESSWALRGPSMLAELSRENADDLVGLSGAPKRVRKGKANAGGYQP